MVLKIILLNFFLFVGPFVSADEVVTLLAQAGLFELALHVAGRFKLSTVPVFEALTARSVQGRVKQLYMCV